MIESRLAVGDNHYNGKGDGTDNPKVENDEIEWYHSVQAGSVDEWYRTR